MVAKVSGKAAVADSQYNMNHHTGNSSTGQEWIIDAYRSLEPSVSFDFDIAAC